MSTRFMQYPKVHCIEYSVFTDDRAKRLDGIIAYYLPT